MSGLAGLYLSTYTNADGSTVKLATTQMEPTSQQAFFILLSFEAKQAHPPPIRLPLHDY